MNRSTLKDELKAKRAASRRVPGVRKHGYRKLVIGDKIYQWRASNCTGVIDIRVPGNTKWTVEPWELQEHNSREEWMRAHANCCHEGCCDACTMFMATPGMIRKYIDKKVQS